MSKYTIIFYTSANGQKPVKTKTLRILSNIKEYGLVSAIPHIKKLTSTPLWEIRILGKDSARILYFIQSKNTIVLLHGFIKKTQKTPPQEISIAQKRYQDLLD